MRRLVEQPPAPNDLMAHRLLGEIVGGPALDARSSSIADVFAETRLGKHRNSVACNPTRLGESA